MRIWFSGGITQALLGERNVHIINSACSSWATTLCGTSSLMVSVFVQSQKRVAWSVACLVKPADVVPWRAVQTMANPYADINET